MVPVGIGTEDDGVFVGLAGKSAAAIIKGVAVSPWTGSLKDGRIKGGSTSCRICKLPAAAVLVKPKRLTRTFACYHTPWFLFFFFFTLTTNHLKFFGATCYHFHKTIMIEVPCTPCLKLVQY